LIGTLKLGEKWWDQKYVEQMKKNSKSLNIEISMNKRLKQTFSKVLDLPLSRALEPLRGAVKSFAVIANGPQKGSNIMEVVIATGIIGMGSLLMFNLFSATSVATSKMKSKLAFANVRGEVLTVLQNSSAIEKAATGGLLACLTSNGSDDCRDGAKFTATIKEPGSDLVIVSPNGAYFTKSGHPTSDFTRAAFVAKLNTMTVRCNITDTGSSESNCDKASTVDSDFVVEPVPENYKLLSLPSRAALYMGGDFHKQYVYRGHASANFNSFKISPELSTNDCNGSATYAGNISGTNHKYIDSTLANPKIPSSILIGISNVSSDGSKASAVCLPTAGVINPPVKGAQGPRGFTGYQGPRGDTGPVGYRATINGGYETSWTPASMCCLPNYPKPNYP